MGRMKESGWYEGQLVIYQCGERFEIGKIKRVVSDEDKLKAEDLKKSAVTNLEKYLELAPAYIFQVHATESFYLDHVLWTPCTFYGFLDYDPHDNLSSS